MKTVIKIEEYDYLICCTFCNGLRCFTVPNILAITDVTYIRTAVFTCASVCMYAPTCERLTQAFSLLTREGLCVCEWEWAWERSLKVFTFSFFIPLSTILLLLMRPSFLCILIIPPAAGLSSVVAAFAGENVDGLWRRHSPFTRFPPPLGFPPPRYSCHFVGVFFLFFWKIVSLVIEFRWVGEEEQHREHFF